MKLPAFNYLVFWVIITFNGETFALEGGQEELIQEEPLPAIEPTNLAEVTNEAEGVSSISSLSSLTEIADLLESEPLTTEASPFIPPVDSPIFMNKSPYNPTFYQFRYSEEEPVNMTALFSRIVRKDIHHSGGEQPTKKPTFYNRKIGSGGANKVGGAIKSGGGAGAGSTIKRPNILMALGGVKHRDNFAKSSSGRLTQIRKQFLAEKNKMEPINKAPHIFSNPKLIHKDNDFPFISKGGFGGSKNLFNSGRNQNRFPNKRATSRPYFTKSNPKSINSKSNPKSINTKSKPKSI